MQVRTHWEGIYGTRSPTEVSWFQEHSDVSIDLIHRTGIGKDGAITDVGGGASRLVDDLLGEGYQDLTVLDVSGIALGLAQQRLGDLAQKVHWIEADITSASLPRDRYDVWHDRAVFHFLTDPLERSRYIQAVRDSVRRGGSVIVATFGPDGPPKCSGLPVVRYSPDRLHDTFGDAFELVEHMSEDHRTPFGTVQKFIYCYCRTIGP